MRRHLLGQISRSDPLIPKLSLMLALLYGLIYYGTAGFISFSSSLDNNLLFVPDPIAMIWQSRGPFLWEPVMQVNFLWLRIQVALPNILLGLLLALLVYGNLTVVLIGLRHPRACRINRKHQGSHLLSMVPALFTGFGCCAPSLIVLWVGIFGGVSTFMVTALRWFLPIGLLLLVIGFISGYRALSKAG